MEAKSFIKLDLKKKIVISAISFFLVILGIIWFIVIPSIRDIKMIRDSIEEQRIGLEKKYIRGQSLKGLSEKIKKVEEKIEDIDNIFVDKDKGLEFIKALEDLAEKNNVIQKINISIDDKVFEDDFKKIPIQLFLQGNLDDQANYLVGLEAMEYYINVDSIDISSVTPGKDEVVNASNYISLLISANTYWKN